MYVLYGADEYVGQWVKKRLPELNLDKFSALGVMQGSKIIAGVVYHNYIPAYKNIEISMTAITPKWVTKNILKQLLSYPFKQLDCQRVTTCTPATNERAIKFNLGIGFRHEGTIRMGCGSEDMIICGMLHKEALRWIGE